MDRKQDAPGEGATPAIEYERITCGNSPDSHASGKYRGGSFIFHAHCDRWMFVWTDNPEYSADGLADAGEGDGENADTTCDPAFVAARNAAFIRSKSVEKLDGYDAGYMQRFMLLGLVEAYLAELDRWLANGRT